MSAPCNTNLHDSLGKTIAYMRSLQHGDGYWWFALEANESIGSEFIFLMNYLGAVDEDIQKGIARRILDVQRPDGTWAIYNDGPPCLSTTVECYFALKIAGLTPEHHSLANAREFILKSGGIEKTRVFTKIHLAMFGIVPWTAAPTMPAEFILIPHWFPFNIYEFSSWARATIVPLLVFMSVRRSKKLPDFTGLDELFCNSPDVRNFSFRTSKGLFSPEHLFIILDRCLKFLEQCPFKPLRNYSINKCLSWTWKHIQRTEDIYPALAYGALAFKALGYSNDSPEIAKPFNALKSFQQAYATKDVPAISSEPMDIEVERLKTLLSEESRCSAWLKFTSTCRRVAVSLKEGLSEPVARLLPAAILAFWLRLRQISQKVLDVALRLRLRAFCSSSSSRSKIQNFAIVRSRAIGSSSIFFSREHEAQDPEPNCAAPESPSTPFACSGHDERRATSDERRIHQQCCISPVWDTPWMVTALIEAGVLPDDPALLRAGRWLISKQITDLKGDWALKNPNGTPGGWAFEFENAHFPDVDDTIQVLTALHRLDIPLDEKEKPCRLGLEWLISMQNDDGGWGAFDKNQTQTLVNRIPFSDHGACLDPSSPDIAGRMIEFLASQKFTIESPKVRRAIDYLWKTQEDFGGWFARWGINYIYGTWCVLTGLCAIGWDMNDQRITKAVRWLESIRHEDGGFGESPESYVQKKFVDWKRSVPSQTAWALMGLVAGRAGNSEAARRAAEFLLKCRNEDGSWDEEDHTGTGFPGHFYIRYHGYRHFFPLLALARWKKGIRETMECKELADDLLDLRTLKPTEHAAISLDDYLKRH